MKDHLKRFVLLIPERYKFDAEECAEYMLLRSQSLNNAEFVRVQKARTCLEKAVELCNILVDKCININNAIMSNKSTTTPLLKFAEAVESIESKGNNNTLANDLRREIEKSTESAVKTNRIRFYGEFPAIPKAFYPRHEETSLRAALQRICKKSKQGCLIVYGSKGVGKATLVARLMADEAFLLTTCGVDTVIWLRCGSFISPTTGLFDRDLFHTELLAGLLQVELDASSYYCSPSNQQQTSIDERLKDAATTRTSPVLVVLDGASNSHVIESTLEIGTSMRCLAITDDKNKLFFGNNDDLPVVEEFCIDKLAGDDILTMFKTPSSSCPLPQKLLNQQQNFNFLKRLVDCSDGLPLISALISANFQDCKDAKQIDARFEQLTSQFEFRINVEDMLQSAIQGEKLQRNAVELIRSCLQILPNNGRFLDAFLLFNPGQPVEPDDMAILWNCSPGRAAEICSELRRRNFLLSVNSVDNSGSKVTRKICLHSVFHSTLFELIVEDNNYGEICQLSELRSRLVDRSPNERGENVLHRAIKNHRRLVLETVLTNVDPWSVLPKLCVEPTGNQRQTPLHYLYKSKWRFNTGKNNYSLFIFCQFIDKLAQLNKQDTLNVLNLEDENGTSIVELVREDVEKYQETEENILFMAARGGYVSLIDLLLSCFVNVNEPVNENSDPALLIAANNGRVGVVELLIRSGVDINTRNRSGYSALMIAALRHDRELANLFFDCEADINAKNKNGDTALILAAKHGDSEFIYSFLQRGANVNAKNCDGESVLLQVSRNASIKGSREMAWELLDCGADVNTSNVYGYTPLILASMSGHVEMAKLLLEQPSIDLNARNIDNLTALMAAARKGHAEIVRLIADHLNSYQDGKTSLMVRKQAVIDAQTILDGETALMYASEKGHGDVVKVLLENGANVDLKNQAGETALDKATKKADTEIVKLFLDHAANNKSVITSYLPGCSIQ